MGFRDWANQVFCGAFRMIGLDVSIRGRKKATVVPFDAYRQGEAVSRFVWLKEHLGFEPRVVVDVGASDGRWARPAMKLFPAARFLLVEPLQEHLPALQKLVAEQPRACFFSTLLGTETGTVRFMKHGHKSSIFGNSKGESFGEPVELPVRRLDDVIKELGLPAPEMLKLDVEGSELLVLGGAPKALESIQVVQMEISLIPFQKGIPLFDELVTAMAQKGFRVFDVFGIHGRPLDGMPVQGECVFIRKDTPLIRDYRWGDNLTWS